ncbi:branched-chain amino acid ABC transporter permease [Xaviernesmea oryzae]|uniref:Branched-chain amino acid ABC transporter permease n=1 Tax=Xaviernesmea oryzae TaxID=464029 RepID=A0A1Q9AT60_9HYPH|nr:AzlC family ABC transporter permease [Xaviernesmea oryzae]OLP58559.1 branched-chain amino acid ABC transporter permease [Xaviernesmea oryzae]SEK61852.1 4-azaleucine resistance probable transporter AzlC [Xaviernesmea oryzae]
MTMTTRRSEMVAGMRTIVPMVVAVAPIGLVFGAVAVGKGLSPLEALAMSALVFAGGSQFVAMDLWTDPPAWAALGFAALLVNLRLILMSASLERALARFSPIQKFFAFAFMADENWALAEARGRRMVLTPAFYFGLSLPFYGMWLISTAAGALLGAVIGDTRPLGLDFAFPAVFIVLLMGFWKGRETGLVLAASASAAIVTHALLPGAWYIAAGALAGLAVSLISFKQERVA